MLEALALVTLVMLGVGCYLLTRRNRRLGDEREEARVAAASESRIARSYRAMVEGSAHGLLLLDGRCRVVVANQRLLDLIGAPSTDLIGRELWAVPGWTQQTSQASLESVCREALRGARRNVEVEPLSDDRPPVELQLHPLLDEAGNPSQLLVEARPSQTIDHAIAAEPPSTETLAIVSQLTNRIAHDVNNPLAGIRLSFLLVKDAIPTSHPHYRFLGAIDREIGRLANFTRRLHESFELRSGLDPRPTLRSVVTEAIMTLTQPDLPVSIDADLGPASRATVAVPGMVLRLVVRNALQDLVDLTTPGGTVMLGALIADDRLVLTLTTEVPAPTAERLPLGPHALPGLGLTMFRRFAEPTGIRFGASRPSDTTVEIRLDLPLTASDRPGLMGALPSFGRMAEPPRLHA